MTPAPSALPHVWQALGRVLGEIAGSTAPDNENATRAVVTLPVASDELRTAEVCDAPRAA